MPVVVKNAVPDIVVVMTSRIFRRPLWKPFTGEIEGQPNGNPAQGRMYRIEQVGMLVEKLYRGSNVARFIESLGIRSIGQENSTHGNQNQNCDRRDDRALPVQGDSPRSLSHHPFLHPSQH